MIDAKTYLRRVGLYDAKINSMIEEVDNLKQMVLRVTPALKQDVVSGGSFEQDKIGAAVSRIIDLQNEINQCIDEFVDARNQVCATLEKVTNEDEYNILYKRYILYHKWEQIATEMNFTYRWVCKLHGRALLTVGRILRGENDG